MPQTETEVAQKRKPAVKTGDIVLADGSWWKVVTKSGQRITGQLLTRPDLPTHRFTTRTVEAVYRELGKRAV